MSDADIEAASAALLELTARGIPVDVQELLVHGNLSRGIAPGALSASFKAAMNSYTRETLRA